MMLAKWSQNLMSWNLNCRLVKTLQIIWPKYIKTLERTCHENEQYSTSECLEISGISSSIEDSTLEDTVLKLFSKLNVLIASSKVEDFHRLKSNNNISQKVIIKLPKRKDVFRVLKAKSNFKNADVTKNGIPPNTPIFANQILYS